MARSRRPSAPGGGAPRLTREAVVRAALDVADAEGVEAVTMRRLAEVLQVHPTSLYHHLPSKAAILDALAEALFAEMRLPATYASWQQWVREVAAGLRRSARAHPRAFLVLTERAVPSTAVAAQVEAALDAFRRGGFTPLRAARCVTVASLALLGVALNECPPSMPWEPPDLESLDAEAFPRIAEVRRLAGLDSDAVWSATVAALLAGFSPRPRPPLTGRGAGAARASRR